jgi:hypothetical protein
MLYFNENKVTNFFIPITLIFILVMPYYLSFLDLLDPDPHSECGSVTGTIQFSTGEDKFKVIFFSALDSELGSTN